jgi:hypothetical protein
MVRLLINYYVDPDFERNEELLICLANNCQNSEIDEVCCFTEVEPPDFGSVEKVNFGGRPTFEDFFHYINRVAEPNDISIICNSDIFFNSKDVKMIKANLQTHECYTLSRYDLDEKGNAVLFDRADSQDAWVFRGRVKTPKSCRYHMGKPGIDNAIAERLQTAGYTVKNPSKSIKSYHVHVTNLRRYNRVETIEKPYLLITPHLIGETPQYRTIQ